MVTAAAPTGGLSLRDRQSKSDLSPARRRLVEVMQDVNFGRIQNLHVVDGEPVFVPPTRVVREIKLGGENGPRPEADFADFTLKSQVVDLFHHFELLGEGVVEVLDIKHGLPFRMTVEAAA